MSEDSSEGRQKMKAKSSQSTYKGTQKYRSDLQAFLQLDYDFIGNQECPHNIVSLIESYKSHQDVRIANSMILNGVCEPMKVDKQYRAEYGNITIDVARRAVELVQNVLSWSGDYEDGSWTAIMELVKRSLPNGVLSGVKHTWKLDFGLHTRLPKPFISNFVPGFVAGLSDEISADSPLNTQFLYHLPQFLDPGVSPFPNSGRRLCFPFLVWERKSDAESSLFKARNQLALPVIKALDTLKAIGIVDLPIMALVTLGAKWELYFGYLNKTSNSWKYIIQRVGADDLESYVGSIKFLHLLQSVALYVQTVFRPEVQRKMSALKTEHWDGVFESGD